MRILLTRNADQSGYGGAEELILNTAKELEKNKFEIVLGTAMPLLMNKASASKITIVRSPWLRVQSWHGWKQLLIPLYLIWLSRLTIWYLWTIKRYSPDIIHPQNRDDWIAASVAGRITSRQVIWSDHADLKHEVKNTGKWYRNWQGKLVLWASKYTKKITVASNADRAEIADSVKGSLDDKLLVAYNGAFDVKPRPVKKTSESFVYGVTARLLRQKGLFELIDAFNVVHSKHPNTALWLVGDGADRAELEQASRNNKSIRFVGYVENPLDYAASFDVFTFPTYTEGFSLSLIEATMLQLPIIATDVGGNPEIITNEKTGLLIPSHDIEALVSAMERMYRDRKLREQLATNARKRFLQDFEFGHLVETVYVPLYNMA